MVAPASEQGSSPALPEHMIVRYGPDLTVIRANQACARACGAAAEEMVGRNWLSFVPHEHRERLRSLIESLSPDSPMASIAYPVVLGAGDVRWCEWVTCAIFDAQDRIVEYQAVGRDITERHQAEERLRMLSATAEQSSKGIAVGDLEGRLLFVNRAFAELHGYAPDELLGKSISVFHTPAQVPAVEAALREMRATGEFNGEIWHARRDGTVFPTLMHNTVLRNEAGEPVGAIATLRDTTELKQADDALRESEERYRALFEQAADTVVLFDAATGTMVDFNTQAHENLGYTREEFARLTVPDYEVIESPEAFARHCAKIVQDGADIFDTKQRTRSGEIRDVQVRARAITLRGRDYLLAFWRDVTDERRATAALAASEERYRAVTESAIDSIFCKDPERRYTFCNQAMQRLLGLRAEQLIGKTPEEVFEPESAATIREVDEAGLRGEIVSATRALHIGDKTLTFHTIQVPLRDESGEIVGIAGVVRDVTEQQRLEEALRNSEVSYRTIFDRVTDALFIHDRETGAILEMNAIARERLDSMGMPAGGFDISALASNEPPYTQEESLRRIHAAAQGRPQRFEWMYRTPQGRDVWSLIDLTAAEIQGKACVLAVVRDITELRRAQEERIRAQKLESLGVLAGGIAHDFNNVLMGLLSSIALARLDETTSPTVARLLGDAEKAVTRAKGLTHQLLTFSRGGAPVRRAASVAELVRETTEFVLTGSSIRPHFTILPDLWEADIDATQISQVVQNLALNAREAMPGGGPLDVAAQNIELTADSDLPIPPGRYVRLVVRDAGIGIAPEHLSRVFDPYFTTKGAGSGLGLAVADSVVRNHGGHIRLDSQLGSGSTFTVYLPAADLPDTPAEAPSATPARRGRILLMDDEPTIRRYIERLLARCGYSVATTADGAEAVELYRNAAEHGEPFDAVILDLTVVNGMGGQACLEQLRALDPDVRAVVASGFHNDPVMAQFRERGFRAAVGKPYTLEELIAALDEATA